MIHLLTRTLTRPFTAIHILSTTMVIQSKLFMQEKIVIIVVPHQPFQKDPLNSLSLKSISCRKKRNKWRRKKQRTKRRGEAKEKKKDIAIFRAMFQK